MTASAPPICFCFQHHFNQTACSGSGWCAKVHSLQNATKPQICEIAVLVSSVRYMQVSDTTSSLEYDMRNISQQKMRHLHKTTSCTAWEM